MASVTVDQGALRNLGQEMADAYAAQVAPAVVRALDAEAPATADGAPRRHHGDRPVRSGAGWLLRFRARPGGGVAVHEGHPVIVPVRAKQLRFVVNGKVVYANSVPAAPGNPWLYRGMIRAGFTGVHRTRR